MFRMIQRLVPIVVIVFTNFIPSTGYSKDAAMNTITTLCFGRFLIDLPAGVHIKEMGQQSSFMFGKITSEYYKGGVDAFRKKMEKHEADSQKGNNPNNFKFIEMRNTSTPNTRIFIFYDDVFGRKLFHIEMYNWENNILYSLFQGPYNDKTIKGVLKELETDLIAKLRYRAPDEIPSEPGFCIENGFISDDGSNNHFEEARIQINFKEWPDVWASVFSQTVPKAGDDSLLERINKHPYTPQQLLMVKTFRKGKHEVREFKGEEIMELLPTENDVKQHIFRWESMGAVNNIFLPRLVLEFETATEPLTGKRPPPSLTDDQAIKLYDTIVNSIRLRPTTSAIKTGQDAPPKTPLGELAATGRICPQTGWWQSNDTAATIAGRRHFTAGDVFPKVTQDPKPGKWQAFKRQPVPAQLSTVWKLIEYDPVPSLVQQKNAPDPVDKPTPSAGT